MDFADIPPVQWSSPGLDTPLGMPDLGLTGPASRSNQGTALPFDSGWLVVGDSGQVTVDFLVDGGAYEGELALFSLSGIEHWLGDPNDAAAFIAEARDRALSDSLLGRVVISDITQAAYVDPLLGEPRSHNRGHYRGPQTFEFTPGDTLGLMLVPHGTVAQVQQDPHIGGSGQPLFSLATANPDDGFYLGQIADATGAGHTFVMEDMRLDEGSDRDYNDLIFQLTGVEAQVEALDNWIAPEQDWRNTRPGQALIDHVSLPVEPTTGLKYRPYELLVKLADDLSEADVADLANDHTATVITPLVPLDGGSDSPLQQWRLMRFASDVDVLNLQGILGQDDRIAATELNVLLSIAETPNDAKFGQQWGLHNRGQQSGSADADVDAPEAWDLTTGSRDVVVAVLDTGIDYHHPDLAANIWVNGGEIAGNRLDDDGNGYVDDVYGYDFSDGNILPDITGVFLGGDPRDVHGHGTHVAGTVGALGNNNLGISGVSPQVSLMPVQFLGDVFGAGSIAEAVAAINYAVVNGADIINASFGGHLGPFGRFILQDAVQAAWAQDVLVVTAAGNQSGSSLVSIGGDGLGGNNNDTRPFYPANFALPNVVSVAATDRNDQLASFSNYGATSVHLAAPGADIISTLPAFYQDIDPLTNTITWKQKRKRDHYGDKSGTSMAAPHVTGAAALMLALNPTLTAGQLKQLLLAAVDPLTSLQGKTVSAGRLNLVKALELATEVDLPLELNLGDLDGSNGFTITGNSIDQGSDFEGYSVSSAGDINNDGIDDFILGAFEADQFGNPGVGQAYIIFGSDFIGNSGSLELAEVNGKNGFIVNGTNAGDNLGFSVSNLGDINADGIDDLIISAPLADISSQEFFEYEVQRGDTLFEISRSYLGDPFRWREIRKTPDGENFESNEFLLVGQRVYIPIDSLSSSVGKSYVLFGGRGIGANGIFEISSLDGTNGFAINGISAGDHSGIAVSGAGDVNGDGLQDLIIGAYWADPNNVNSSGESYVVFGKSDIGATGILDLKALDGSNGFSIQGSNSADQLGYSLSGLGDVNNDGIDDIIIGSPTASSSGTSYVIFGDSNIGANGSLLVTELNGENGFSINGISLGDLSGYSVNRAGDVNNDGVADLIIGAYRANGRAGESYVVFGDSELGKAGAFELSELNGRNGFSIQGAEFYDNAGVSVSGPGDVNGDGVDDLIIGASSSDIIGTDPNSIRVAGEAYIVFGHRNIGNGGIFDLSRISSSNGIVINGIDATGNYNALVDGLGDINNDGISDFIVSPFSGSPYGSDVSGKSYVVFGTNSNSNVIGDDFDNGEVDDISVKWPRWFFSEELNLVGDDGSFDNTSAVNAHAFFTSLLDNPETIDFEDVSDGELARSTNTVFFNYLAGPTVIGATPIKNPVVRQIPLGSSLDGGYASSVSQVLQIAADDGVLRIDFTTPQEAFGFYASDIGDPQGQVLIGLRREDGSVSNLISPNTFGSDIQGQSYYGSTFFYGVINYDTPFTSAFISNWSDTDGFVIDDFVIGAVDRAALERDAGPPPTNLFAFHRRDTPYNLPPFTITDPDGEATVRITLADANAGAGTFTTPTFNGITSTYDATTGIWQARGSVSTVNALLANVQFIPTSGDKPFFSDVSIQIDIIDNPENPKTKILTRTILARELSI